MSKRVYLLCLAIGLFSAGCKTPSVTTQSSADQLEFELAYEYPAQVLAMPSCGATVVERKECYVVLQRDGTKDSKNRFSLGGAMGNDTVGSFIDTLEVGKWYPLPDAFMKHLKTTKRQEPNN
jgi:hypothetical protein